jgi:hypothetical protein
MDAGGGRPTHTCCLSVPFTVEDLARTALVRILPRSRYRLAGQGDSRFQSFASSTSRIAYRQQGGTPALLLFSGPGQDPGAAATAAAAWAEANWRPNAIQRTVRPGVVVVQVAPAAELVKAGLVAGTAVPAAVWTIDSETGQVATAGNPPGSPPGTAIRSAAAALLRGQPAPTLGELDLAERAVMQVRTVGMPRGMVGGALTILLVIFAFRYGLRGLFSLFDLPSVLSMSGSGPDAGNTAAVLVGVVVNVVLLAGILLGAGLLFNFRNIAFRMPGFSSPVPRTRSLTWGCYIAAMIVLAVVLDGVLPAIERSNAQNISNGQYAHVSATAADDGTDTYVAVGGDLTVDLSDWPSSEWPGVQFKTSNPSVLALVTPNATSGPPTAHFSALQTGAARVDAASADGRYTFELRVMVIGS